LTEVFFMMATYTCYIIYSQSLNRYYVGETENMDQAINLWGDCVNSE